MRWRRNSCAEKELLRLVLGVDEDHVVRNDAGGHALRSILVRDLSVVDPALDDGALAFAQVLQNGLAQVRLEHDNAVPIGALSPVAGFEPGMGRCERGIHD